MKRLLLTAAVLALSACAPKPPATGAQTPADKVFAIRAGYDAAFLGPAANYNELARCAAAQAPTLAKPCSRQSIVIVLRKADQTAKAALDSAEELARNHPTFDVSTAIAAAQAAVNTAVTACQEWCAGTQE